MNTLEIISNTIKQNQKEVDKQVSKLLAEVIILYYEIEYVDKKGVTSK